MEIVNALVVALVTGAFSSGVTLIALKVDIKWMKETQADQEARIRRLERAG